MSIDVTSTVSGVGITKGDTGARPASPFVDGGKEFIGGEIRAWNGKTVDVTSPIIDETTGARTVIGKIADMTGDDALKALEHAMRAWDNGRGAWPQLSGWERIEIVKKIQAEIKQRRSEIINVLIWEICKSVEDATSEFDRTMEFIDASIDAYTATLQGSSGGAWKTVNGIMASIRKAAIGIMLCLGPFNYPFNETYATLIPALLTGNVVIMKIPAIGCLAHVLTMEAYAKHLPKGVINFVSGSGRVTVSPLMKTGKIDILAFIGGSRAADAIIKDHPNPHRLKVFLQLEGKNLGVVLPDADLDVAVEQVTIGSTTYNGQRCTAIKLVMVHKSIIEPFLAKIKSKFKTLKHGMPWDDGVKITPLPEPNKPKYLQELMSDAKKLGAEIVNESDGGGTLVDALMIPALVYPVTGTMRLWHEEQFGPVVPIAVYDDIEEVYEYLARTPFGQQAAIFTKDPVQAGPIVDVMSTVVGRVNINTQCGRSPDVFPFSGRRSSAMGTMSVTEALNQFSVETVVAAKKNEVNEEVLLALKESSHFLR